MLKNFILLSVLELLKFRTIRIITLSLYGYLLYILFKDPTYLAYRNDFIYDFSCSNYLQTLTMIGLANVFLLCKDGWSQYKPIKVNSDMLIVPLGSLFTAFVILISVGWLREYQEVQAVLNFILVILFTENVLLLFKLTNKYLSLK